MSSSKTNLIAEGFTPANGTSSVHAPNSMLEVFNANYDRAAQHVHAAPDMLANIRTCHSMY